MTSNELEEVRSSMIQIKLGNRTYPLVQNKSCGVCMHPARLQIEEKILLNFGWHAISRHVSNLNKLNNDGSVEDWYELSWSRIKRHYENGHCPVEAEMMQVWAQERAEARGIKLEDSVGQQIDYIVTQKAILARGTELLMKGQVEPDLKDVAFATKFLSDLDQSVQQNLQADQMLDIIEVYFSAVREVVSADQWDKILKVIEKHPVVKAIEGRNTIEAEVVE